MSLTTTIKSIRDTMRKDAGVSGDAQRIEQLAWLFFLKIWDDREQELELLYDDYRSPIPDDLRWRNWAADDEGITGDNLLEFIDGQLFPTLKELEPGPPVGGDSPEARAQDALRRRKQLVRDVFEDAHNFMKSGTLLRQVINKIEAGIDFNNSKSRHLFGEIYESILKELQSAGAAGEFYTPRAVTQFAVDRIDPKLGETILDPACGTGGFLTGAIEHVRRRYVHTGDDEELLQRSIRGTEKKPLPHLLCMTNLIVHGIDVPTGIRHGNALTRPIRDYGASDRVDVILTNPPFGGMEEDTVTQSFPKKFQTRETADLFLVLILTILKPGGRAAVVLPDGSLFGEGVKTRIKEKLLSECRLHTIVRLPNGVFSPYTGIRTNILFFEKARPTQELWFYEHPYPEGYKSYSKTKPMRVEEFEPEREWWDDRKETEQAWKVTIDEIVERGYNLDIKNPNTPDEGPGDPDEWLARFQEASHRADEIREQLRSALSEALERAAGA